MDARFRHSHHYTINQMIQRGDENPYLKGKPPKKHIGYVLRKEPDQLAGLNDQQRTEVAQQIGAKAKSDFASALKEIQRTIRSVNPLQLLAHFGYYDQLWLEGTSDSRGYIPTQQSAVEWLQALILQVPETVLQSALDEAPVGEICLKVNECLNSSQRAFGLMRLGEKTDASGALLVAELVRQHTAFVRNEGFPSQIRRLVGEIFRPMDRDYRAREGYSLTELVEVLWALHALVEQRVNADMQRRKIIFGHAKADRVIAAFCDLTGQSVDGVRESMRPFVDDVDAVKAAVMNWLDERNYSIFYFNEGDFCKLLPADVPPEAAQRILHGLSVSWGGLAEENPEHLILHNPVWTKPLIAVGNHHYFVPIISLIQSFGLEIVENFLRTHPDLWQKYCTEIRGAYLEDRTEEALRHAFPEAKVFRGLHWRSTISAQQGESDVLVLLDTHALVFECKSGRLRGRASRGDLAALRDEIGKLMEDPAKQGGRFADFLLAQKRTIRLQDAHGTWHELDCAKLMRVTTVSVVLDYFGQIVTQQHLLRKAGFIGADAAPSATIPLHDLECVLDILDRPAIAFHYLRRRAEIESANEILSEELGLLATYLATAFDMGDFEGDENRRFMIPTMADELTPYFMGKEIGAPVPKPKLRLRGWWSDMLRNFEERKFLGWVEASYVLVGINYERQKLFEQNCRRLMKSVRSSWHQVHDDTCIMVSGPKNRRTAVVCVAVKNKDRFDARDLVSQRIQLVEEREGASRILAICVSAGERSHPYLGVYFHAPDLEDRAQSSSPPG